MGCREHVAHAFRPDRRDAGVRRRRFGKQFTEMLLRRKRTHWRLSRLLADATSNMLRGSPWLFQATRLDRRRLQVLEITPSYELAPNGLNFSFYLGGLHSAYVRGQCFIATHRYPEAAAEFRRILDHPGIVGADPIGALAHLQLCRVFALSGDKIRAKAAYQAFLALWKDSDPDVPVLKTAKAEYGRL